MPRTQSCNELPPLTELHRETYRNCQIHIGCNQQRRSIYDGKINHESIFYNFQVKYLFEKNRFSINIEYYDLYLIFPTLPTLENFLLPCTSSSR